MIEVREFSFFLDAWLFCQKIKLDWQKSIKRKDWDTWSVAFEAKKPEKSLA